MNDSSLKFICIGSLLILYSEVIYSQELFTTQDTPEWVVQTFFKSENFADKEKYFIGEMKVETSYPTIGEELKGKGEIVFYIIDSTAQKKVFAVNLKTDSIDLDFYCFLSDSAGWKIDAVRRFLFPKFIYIVSDSLSSLDSLSQADSAMFKILYLMTATDDEIKKYFIDNSGNFEKLLQYFKDKNKEMASMMINKLSLNGIFRDEKYPGCIFIQIAGLESREIGFIYKETDGTLPKISSTKFIFIGRIISGWYLYRLI